MKRKPGLGETVKVKKKVAERLGHDLARRTALVVNARPVCGYDVIVEVTGKSGAKFDLAMNRQELKRA